MKQRVMTIALTVLTVFFATGCTVPVVPATAGAAPVPTEAPASTEPETGAHAAPATTHAGSESHAAPTPSAYRELLDGEIRGFDAETVAAYLAGDGLGMALPAELNGYPGPRHVLDLQTGLELTPEQVVQVQALFDDMQPRAIDLGKAILAAEAQLEAGFRNRSMDEESLRAQLQQLGDLHAQLRFVHLNTHLATVEILSPHQVRLYNSLRGYAEMPAGHERHVHQ